MNTPALLIDARSLAGLAVEQALIVDCRFALGGHGQGEQAYRQAHIPHARYADLDRDLSDLSKPGLGRHPLPDAGDFVHRLAAWGWQPGRRVIVYDDAGGSMAAARLHWMLACAGIASALLDGGWQAWQAAGLPIERGAVTAARNTTPTLHFSATAAVDYAELDALRQDPAALILDARGAPRFRGDQEPFDRAAGHVPGARNRPWQANLDAKGHFKSADLLRKEFTALLGGRAPSRVVHMCGSGVFACHNQFAMELAGLTGSRVFVPSWSGWCSDPARPVATGD